MVSVPILGILVGGRSGRARIMADDAAHDGDRFAEVFPTYVAAFSRLMIALRREFDGDLDMALILAVIGERHFARRTRPDAPTYDTLGHTETTPTPSINALSLSQYTGIPRETARRKVAALIKRGWVVADRRGSLSPTPEAAADLRRATDEALGFMATMKVGRRSDSMG
jgi:hypothetical protein